MNHILLTALVLLPLFLSALTFLLGKLSGRHGHAVKSGALILVTLLEFAASVLLFVFYRGTALSVGNGLVPFALSFDGLPAIYAVVTTFTWLGASLLSPHYFKKHGISDRYAFFFLFTLGSTLGVFLSSHLLTTFVFFELMSLASFAWVAEEETLGARKAGKTYLTVAVIGGMVTLMGLFLLYHLVGTLDVASVKLFLASTKHNTTELYAAALCILVGFGAKAGIFPLHIWLPKAHPVAPAPASALLSGILTKTGIFGILIVSANLLPGDHLWGTLLLAIGTVTMLLGAILAVLSVNLKRTLACSSLSQIGFILVGVSMLVLLGEENALAAYGTVLYMMNHSIVKLVLFLAAGAIYALSHTLDLNALRGFGRKRPLLALTFLVGGASLAGIPGTLGYLSKTLVHEAIVEYAAHTGNMAVTVVEWLFLLSGGLTAAYVTKLFVTIFIEKPRDTLPTNDRLPLSSWIALLLGVVPILLLGCTPHRLAERVAELGIAFIGGHEMHHAVHYLAFANLKGVLISLSIGTVVYLLVIRVLLTSRDREGRRIHVCPIPETVSMENLVYVPLGKLLTSLMTFLARVLSGGIEALSILVFRLYRMLSHVFCDLPDLFVLGARTTVLRPVAPPELRPKHALLIRFGSWVDRNFRKNDESANTPELLIRISETLSTVTHKITGNFSFSLLMACLGILAILVALVFLFY